MATKNILVVDGDTSTRMAMSVALRQTGYRVSAALNSEEALSILFPSKGRERSFDLLIVDTEITGAQGKRLIDAVKQKGGRMPVIHVSNFSDKAFFIDLLNNGHKEFIEKTCAKRDAKISM
jgi:two-component system nitrogen regulation response regulator GlnG